VSETLPAFAKLLLGFFGLLFAALLVIGVGTIAGAVLAGPTIRGGERAVVALAAFDLTVAAVTFGLFAWLTAGRAAGWQRALWLLAFATVLVAMLAIVGFSTLVILNR
jgi:hypothetical protein